MKKALHLKFVLSLAVVGLLAVTFVAVRHNTSAATATPAASNEQTENHRDRIQTQPVSIQMEVARKL